MGEIFRNAGLVLGCLGALRVEITQAFDVIKAISKDGRNRTKGGLGWMHEMGIIRESDQKDQTPEFNVSPEFLTVLEDLVKLPYFRRMWILQEIVLAKKLFLLSGDQSIDFALFEDLWIVALNMTDLARIPKQWGGRTRGVIMEIGLQIVELQMGIMILKNDLVMNTWNLIHHAKKLKSTDPRDMIYGLLGIHPISLIPDYSKPVRDVYLELARIILEQNHSLNILCPAGIKGPEENPFDLPSWLPHFSSLDREHYRDDYIVRYANEGLVDTVSTGTRIDDNGCLRTCGYVCDTISMREAEIRINSIELVEFCQKFLDNQNNQKYRYDMPRLHVLFATLYESTEHPTFPEWNPDEDAEVLLQTAMGFMRTILQLPNQDEQQFQDRLSDVGYPASGNFVQSLFKDIFYDRTYKMPDTPSHDAVLCAKDDDTRRELWDIVMRILLRNYLFHTSSGLLGMGREQVEAGDFVCILNHCNLPVILRRVDEQYIFVGCCFVFGLMNGEAKGIVEAEGIKQQEFIIR